MIEGFGGAVVDELNLLTFPAGAEVWAGLLT